MGLKNAFGAISLDDTLFHVVRLLKTISKPFNMVTSGTNRLSVDVNSLPTLATVTTVTTVTTTGTVSNQTNMGGVSAFELQKSNSRTAFATSVRPSLN